MFERPGWLGRREFCALAMAGAARITAAPAPVSIAYQVAGSIAWPLLIAGAGGYYAKYGVAAKPVFAAYPGGVAMLLSDQASMLLAGLQQLLPAAVKDPSLATIGGLMNRSTFSLIARKGIASIRDLRGKRIAISQLGDSTYGYLLAVLREAGLSERDVQLTPVGAEPSRRAAALASGRADATLLSAPASFRMEDAGYRNLANLAADKNIFTTIGYWVRRPELTAEPGLVDGLIQGHAEAIRRFYDDKSFAVRTYLAYDREAMAADVARTYDLYKKLELFERVPYVLKGAVEAALDQQTGAARSQLSDFRASVDNSVIDRLVMQGFFVKVFGASVKAEQDEKARLSFR